MAGRARYRVRAALLGSAQQRAPIDPYRAQRRPYLGWYDEGNPEETDWEIKWQVEHGIGFEQHCWYRPNNAVNHPIKDGVLDQGIIKGLFNARYGHLKKFTLA